MVTKSKRDCNNRWDKENMKVIACKVRKDVAEAFKEQCARDGTTPNAVFRAAIEQYLSRDSNNN